MSDDEQPDHCTVHYENCQNYCRLFSSPKLKVARNLPIIPRREMKNCRNPSRTKLITVKRFRSESVAMGHNDVRFAPKEMFIDELFS